MQMIYTRQHTPNTFIAGVQFFTLVLSSITWQEPYPTHASTDRESQALELSTYNTLQRNHLHLQSWKYTLYKFSGILYSLCKYSCSFSVHFLKLAF